MINLRYSPLSSNRSSFTKCLHHRSCKFVPLNSLKTFSKNNKKKWVSLSLCDVRAVNCWDSCVVAIAVKNNIQNLFCFEKWFHLLFIDSCFIMISFCPPRAWRRGNNWIKYVTWECGTDRKTQMRDTCLSET